MARYIFITGGVVSSLGKGLASAALGALLQARGYSVRLRKLDPYLNVDPGTMSPYQHGEVFVTDDGAETDLDLGHYERFTGRAATQADNVCRVAWEAGSVAIWDNRTTWHFASNDYQGHAREMHRITLTGEPLAA